jgi:hypothetical protein
MPTCTLQAYKARDRLVEAGIAAKADAIAYAAEAAENVITAQAGLAEAQAAVAGEVRINELHAYDCTYRWLLLVWRNVS